jgi:hypothetical protein
LGVRHDRDEAKLAGFPIKVLNVILQAKRVAVALFSVAVAATSCLTVAGRVSSQSSTGAAALGVYVYPQKGQSASKQSSDESECYKSATQRTGVNLAAAKPTPAPHPTVQGGAAHGAARGAAVGAVGGAIGGDAGKGAGYGALAGAIHGRRMQNQANTQAQQQAQQKANAQYAQNVDKLKRAFESCLDARGYSVK